MNAVPRDSKLWEYMPDEIRDLIEDGEVILNFVLDNICHLPTLEGGKSLSYN